MPEPFRTHYIYAYTKTAYLFLEAHNAVLAQFTIPTFSPHFLALRQEMLAAAHRIQLKPTCSVSSEVCFREMSVMYMSICLASHPYLMSFALKTVQVTTQRKCHNERLFISVFEGPVGVVKLFSNGCLQLSSADDFCLCSDIVEVYLWLQTIVYRAAVISSLLRQHSFFYCFNSRIMCYDNINTFA